MDIAVTNLNAGHLSRFLTELEKGGKECVEKMAVTGQSLIQDRIQERGIPGRQYSTNKLPSFFFEGRGLNAKGRKVAKEGISYKEFRQNNGLQTDHVDFTFSGRMFGGTRLLRVQVAGTSFVAQVGGTDRETDEKLGYLLKQFGNDVFDPTPEEQQEIDVIAEDFLASLFEDYI